MHKQNHSLEKCLIHIESNIIKVMGCRLSIIVPVYNVEKYVGQCLSSIFSKRNESYPFEVIIVNDGTKDNSLQIIKPYIEKFNNCFLINQKN